MLWEKKKDLIKREYTKTDLNALSEFYFRLIIQNLYNPTEMSKFISEELMRFKPSEIAEYVSHYIQDVNTSKDKRSIVRIIDDDLIGDYKNLMNQYWIKKHRKKIYN